MRWSERQTHLFVKMYLNHKCLWDKTDEHYKTKFKRRAAYRDIVEKFHALTNILIDERVVMNKIRGLRSTYCQELAKIRKRENEAFTPTLRWFSDWHKCFQRVSSKSIRRSSDDQEGDTEPEDTSKDWIGDDVEFATNSDLDREPLLNKLDEEEYNILLLKQEPEIDVEPLQTYKTRKKKRNSNFGSENSGEASTVSTNPNEDEFDYYAKYIASQLRKMDIERALRVQLQIQSLISEARIDSLSRTE